MVGGNASDLDVAAPYEAASLETKWQAARRRRRGAVDRVVSVVFGVLAIAVIGYVIGLARVVAPHLVD